VLREETYINVARTFGCSTGVASHMAPPSDKRIGRGIKMDDINVNKVIAKTIVNGEYKEFRRKVLKMEKNRDKREKESTFYKKILNGSTDIKQ
jgi:hypothetical protein